MPTASLTAPALGLLLCCLVAVFLLPRRLCIAPLLAATVLMTLGQSIEIGGARFYFLRIVILATWLRMIIRRDHTSLSFNSVDKSFLMWACFSIFVGFIPKPIHPDAVEPAATFTSTLIHQGGFVLDGFGTYFLVRHLIRDSNDIVYALRVMVIICLVLAGFMAFEKLTRRNLFSVFGVVPEITMERDGRFRCQGPFTHPIHAGNYGATLMPACIGLWFFGFRKFAGIAFLGAAMVTIASASSGPLMACIYGLMAFCFWPLRERMRQVRWALLLLTVTLHLCMKAPVWWAISKLADFVGGGGYWRSKLIDQFVNHFSEWWLIGTSYTAHWSPTGVGLPLYPDNMDLTNQFVVEGVHGGLLQLILFIMLLARCFQWLGLARNVAEENRSKEEYLVWSLGCCLVAYMAAFIAVAGSMQTDILFYCLLGFIAASPTTLTSESDSLTEHTDATVNESEEAVPST